MSLPTWWLARLVITTRAEIPCSLVMLASLRNRFPELCLYFFKLSLFLSRQSCFLVRIILSLPLGIILSLPLGRANFKAFLVWTEQSCRLLHPQLSSSKVHCLLSVRIWGRAWSRKPLFRSMSLSLIRSFRVVLFGLLVELLGIIYKWRRTFCISKFL